MADRKSMCITVSTFGIARKCPSAVGLFVASTTVRSEQCPFTRLFSGRSMIRGASRIHGELRKLGFELSERSVSRRIRRAPRDADPVKRRLTFLRNHREAIAAMDFIVPTLTCNVL